MRIFFNAGNCEKVSLSETYVSDTNNKQFVTRKGWEKPVPAAAVIPVAQMMIYTRFKTWEACLASRIKIFFYEDSKSNFLKLNANLR